MPAPARPGPPHLDVPAGYTVAGYRVAEPLGAGAWGSVYAAHRPGGGPADLAVKFLCPARLSPGQRRTMAQLARSEMRFGRRADHPNLIRTLAVLTVADPAHPGLDGALALVMERAERSLQDVLAAARPHTPVPDAERILAGVCAGLAHMHAAGWVHGDLKPGNILLMPDGTARLADFGLTAELEGTHAYAPPLGSPDHVPPEWWSQRTGARGVAVRPSADIWAFGVLDHQLLTGGLHPFLGATARARALAAQAYARGVAPLRLDDALPARWRPAVAACLTADRAERGRVDLAALRVALLAAAEAPGSAGAPGARGPVRAPRPERARRLLAGAGPAALVAAVLLFAGGPEPSDRASTGLAPGVPTAPASGGPPSGGAPQAPPSATAALAPAGGIPAGSDIPEALRGPIQDAARRCPEPEITPALLAAVLKAESGFDPEAARPETGEYGVAMWTPTVFNAWAQDGDHDGTKDYMDPADAIVSMGNYVCWLDQQLKRRGYTRDLPALITAGYRTSDKTVADAGGVPDRVKPHVARVLGYLAEYGG
ncbi:protein kinase [Kitasatospora sp. NPDC086009]|uniref:protein kinase domain-containing protein n=1 Tax=unclassified Kitasatospora TaxID=2633591 RepID=UPI0037C5E9FC